VIPNDTISGKEIFGDIRRSTVELRGRWKDAKRRKTLPHNEAGRHLFPSGSGYSRRRLSSVPVGHIPEPGRRPGNDPALGLPVQNSRLRLGEAKPEIAFLVLGPGELDTRKRGNLSSGHKRQTEARVSVSP